MTLCEEAKADEREDIAREEEVAATAEANAKAGKDKASCEDKCLALFEKGEKGSEASMKENLDMEKTAKQNGAEPLSEAIDPADIMQMSNAEECQEKCGHQ